MHAGYDFGRDIDSMLYTKKAKAEVPVPEVSMDEENESETEPMAQEEDDKPKVTLLVSCMQVPCFVGGH